MKPLWIFGSGGHAKVVIDAARMSGKFDVIGCLDDEPSRCGKQVLGVPIVGPLCSSAIAEHHIEHAIIAIGSNAARHAIAARFGDSVQWAVVVHPGAIIANSVSPCEGSVIFAGAVVQPDAQIGRHVIINTSSSVDHDAFLGDFCHIAPGAHLAGSVAVGAGSLIGIGVSVIPGKAIGDWSMVGAGSAVTDDLPSNITAVGAPARAIRNHRPGWHLD